MGCGCQKLNLCENDLNVSQENEDNLKTQELNPFKNENKNNKKEILKSEALIGCQKDDENDDNEEIIKNEYNKRAFDLINKIRLNPLEYSKIILDNIKNIVIENQKELNKINGIEELNQIIVFKKKVKVKLYKGEESFIEAAKILENTPTMGALKFNKNIVIPISNSEEDIKNSKDIKNKINEIMKKSNINAYFKENIKNPEIAILLMIVDDTEFSKGKKRKSILNRDYKNIGIDSKFIGKNFVAHFSFSK